VPNHPSRSSRNTTRTHNRAVRERASLRDGNLPLLPGLEWIRDESRPMPEVAELPFALTPPVPQPPRRVQTSLVPPSAVAIRRPRRPAARPPARARLPLLARLDVASAWGVIGLPGEGHEGLQNWLAAHEHAHGREEWFARIERLIDEGNWSRARDAALARTTLLVIRGSMRAKTLEEREAIMALLRRKSTATPKRA
jgi:hypothetical protein